MSVISQAELFSLAARSKVGLEEQEVKELGDQLENILNYVACVQEIDGVSEPVIRCPFTQRADVIVPFDGSLLLDRAPDTRESYFVVPRVIEQTS